MTSAQAAEFYDSRDATELDFKAATAEDTGVPAPMEAYVLRLSDDTIRALAEIAAIKGRCTRARFGHGSRNSSC